MFEFLKNRAYPIGIDLGNDGLKMIQLAENGSGITLIAGRTENRPVSIEPGTCNWQKWAIDAMKRLTANGSFRGKDVTATIPAAQVFVEHTRMPKTADGKIEDALLARIKQKLPFDCAREQVMTKYIPAEDDNVLVLVTERAIIDRHLAIYEKAALHIKAITAWPTALAQCYAKFFGRRQSDLEAVVMLLCIEPDHTNLVICRHKNLLFARSISIAAPNLEDERTINRLVMEIDSSKRQFSSIYRNVQMERLIFLTGQVVDKETCGAIAKQLEIPAQMGDCLAAIKITDLSGLGIDRRNPVTIRPNGSQRPKPVNWTTAFGLSLS